MKRLGAGGGLVALAAGLALSACVGPAALTTPAEPSVASVPAAPASAGRAGAGSARAAAVPQAVRFASVERQPRGALPVPGFWFRARTATAPAPAMVLLHGCGGLYDERGRLGARYLAVAGWLNARGVHVLLADSLTPRGETELCTQRYTERKVTMLERRRDAQGALQWLAAQPGVDAARLGLLGWSHGGSTVLAATNLRIDEVSAAAPRPSLAVAFYPSCEAELRRGYDPSAALLMLLGEADDWTPAAPCKALAAASAASAGAGVPPPRFETYAGAHHGFDGAGPVRRRTDVPGGVQPGAGVHVGGDPAARAAAQAALDAFLRERWRLAS